MGDLEKARAHLESALTEAQSTSKAQLPSEYPASIRYKLALLAYKQNRFGDAKAQLELTSAVATENPELIRPELMKSIVKLRSLLDRPHPT
jgi:hypothetical protein